MSPYRRPNPMVLTLCLLLVGFCAYAESPEPPLSQEYVLRVWDSNDGLPSNRISSLAQTPDGYLWAATIWGGLARFDGVRFTAISDHSIQRAAVASLFAAKDGALWVGLERGGVARYKEGKFEIPEPVAPLSADISMTNAFTEDGEGNIWFGRPHDSNFHRIMGREQGKIESFKFSMRDNSNVMLTTDVEGKVWSSVELGAGCFDGTKFKPIGSKGICVRITPAASDGIWEMKGRQLFRCHADGREELVTEFPWLDNQPSVNALYLDREGNLWIGTRNKGLFRYRDGDLVKVPTSHSSILSLFEDREGNLWAGTEQGLNRLHRRGFALLQTKNGLLHDSAISLCEDKAGHLWIVGRHGAPVCSQDSANTRFATPPGWTGGAVMAVWPDPEEGIWLGILGDLKRWHNGAFSYENLFEQITSGLVDRNGDLWIATINGGLIRRHADQVEKIPTADGLIRPRALTEDKSGRLWVGTEDGSLFYREGERFTRVPLPGSNPGEQIRFIVPDENGVLWIGAFGGNLYWWDHGRVGRFPEGSGVPESEIYSLLIEPEGDFWFGTARGLLRIPKADMEGVKEGRQGSLRRIGYGRNEGLPGLEFAVGFRNSTVRTRDGRLWFGTYSGALEVTPWELRKSVPLLPVIVERTVCRGKSFAVENGKVVLPAHPGAVQIEYTLPELSSPDQVAFRYRLRGLSDEWVYVKTQRSALFARLGPGNYQFEVSATEANGAWLSAASLGLTVEAAWWETTWFQLACVLAGIAGLIGTVRFVVRRRLRARMRKLEQEATLERERARIARDMHDELGANLTQIVLASKLLKLEPPEEVYTHTDEISAIARRTVESLDEIVWAVDPSNDALSTLFDYIGQFAIDFLSAADIECELEIADDLPLRLLGARVRHYLFLLVKEALNNAVKHSGATKVVLTIVTQGDTLVISITDNGCGFDPTQKKEGSDGLGNMANRMAELGGSCHIESTPEKGTTVRFDLPLDASNAKARQ